MKNPIDLVKAAVAFAIVSAAALWQFGNWLPRVFFGDDLAAYIFWQNGKLASTLSQMFFEQGWGKISTGNPDIARFAF